MIVIVKKLVDERRVEVELDDDDLPRLRVVIISEKQEKLVIWEIKMEMQVFVQVTVVLKDLPQMIPNVNI